MLKYLVSELCTININSGCCRKFFVRYKTDKFMNMYLRNSKCIKRYMNSSHCYRSSDTINSEGFDNENHQRKDISRLSYRLRSMQNKDFHGYHKTQENKNDISYICNSLGLYGRKTGINPKFVWPNLSQLRKLKETEAECLPQLENRIKEAKQIRENERLSVIERRKNIEECMKKMPKLLAEFNEKEEVIKEERRAAQEKKQQLLDEAREFFGYEVNPLDAKFQQMVEQKEKDELLAEKKRKKEQKVANLMLKYQAMASRAGKEQTSTDKSVENQDNVIEDGNESNSN